MPRIKGADHCSAARETVLVTNKQKKAYSEEASDLKMEEIDEELLRRIYERHRGEPGFVITTWEEYRDLVKRAYPILIGVAKRESLMTYGEIGSKIGLYIGSDFFQLKIGIVVGACSGHEHEKGRPLISSIVVNETTRHPSMGFWGLPGIPDSIRRQRRYWDVEPTDYMSDEMAAFWASEVKRVYQWWKHHDC